jgi:phage baseplate assembly protein W
MAQKFIGVTLPIRMGQTGMFEQSVDTIQQVRSNFKNLILTKKGERVGQPTFGCDVWNLLFEPLTDEILEAARIAIIEAVDTWMPFIELIKFNATKSDRDASISIECVYRFRNNPNVVNQVNITTDMLGVPLVDVLNEREQNQENVATRIARRNARTV